MCYLLFLAEERTPSWGHMKNSVKCAWKLTLTDGEEVSKMTSVCPITVILQNQQWIPETVHYLILQEATISTDTPHSCIYTLHSKAPC